MQELRHELQIDDMNLRRCVLNRSATEGAAAALRALCPIYSWAARNTGVGRPDSLCRGNGVDDKKGSLK